MRLIVAPLPHPIGLSVDIQGAEKELLFVLRVGQRKVAATLDGP